MPLIQRYACDRCDFQLPTGWGGWAYATDDAGKRVVCPHPAEDETVRRVTGMSWTDADRAGRAGFNSDCVCLACLGQFNLDLKRDQIACPTCSSPHVRTTRDLVDQPCPKCTFGVVREGSPIRWELDPDRASLPVPEVVKDLVAYHRSREPTPVLRSAYDVVCQAAADGRFGDTSFYRYSGRSAYHVAFFTFASELLDWWEGAYFGGLTGRGTEPHESLEMNPQWLWCRVLPDVLRLVPELDELVCVRDGRLWFRDGVSADARRGMKNYIREHREHVLMT